MPEPLVCRGVNEPYGQVGYLGGFRLRLFIANLGKIKLDTKRLPVRKVGKRREVVDLLAPAGRGEIMDGTVGGGGHALALLERYPECRILAVDRYTVPSNSEQKSGIAPLRERLQAEVDARYGHANRRVLVTSGTSGALVLARRGRVSPS